MSETERFPRRRPAPDDLLHESRQLAEAIRSLRALLELQREQIDSFEERLYPDTPGGAAARRLVALKRRGA